MEKGKLKKIVIIGGSIVVAAGIGFGIYMMVKKNTKSSGSGSSTPSTPAAPTQPLAVKTATDPKTYLITPNGQKYPVPSQERFLEITGHNTWDYPISILSDLEIANFPTAVSWA